MSLKFNPFTGTFDYQVIPDGILSYNTTDKTLYSLTNGSSTFNYPSYTSGFNIDDINIGAGASRFALQTWIKNSVDASNVVGGYWGGVYESGAAVGTSAIYGLVAYNQLASTNARTHTSIWGLYAANEIASGSNITATDIFGAYFQSIVTGGTITSASNLYGAFIDGTSGGIGTITNSYGLRINKQSAGTNNYELWLNGAGASFYRAGTQAIWSSAVNTLDLTANTTFNLKLGANPANGTAGTIYAKLNSTGLALLMGTATPTNAISISGNAARKMWMERHTTANTAGNILTIESGGATSGATNKAGGKLIVSSGIATGTGSSSFEVWTAAAGATGTADRSPSVKLAIAGTGAQTLTQTGGIVGITQNLTNTTTTAGQNTQGSFWNVSHNAMVDSTLYGLQMQLGGTVVAGDSGASSIQGFAFEVYEDGTGVGAPATALGGFIRHSSTLAGLTFTGCNIDIQVGSSAGAAMLVLYETGVSAIGANTTSWTGYHVSNPVPSAGAITNVYGLKIDALTGGATNYAIYSAGGQSVHAGNLKLGDTTAPTEQLEFADAKNIKFQTTTGTKIGTATSQKLAFWNATPIIQPTTGVAAATFVAGAGTAVNDASTFDGYTLKQVVKALRNEGLLA